MKYGACKHCLKQQTFAFKNICQGCDELLNWSATLIFSEKRWSSDARMAEVEA